MDRIDRAFSEVDRQEFLPKKVRSLASYDEALPIGYGQTNSQPYTVRLMLQWLDPQRGDKILDVGSGSGWTSALLSKIVGKNGLIYAVEKVPELVTFGRDNLKRMGIKNVEVFEAGEVYGLPEHAPYNRILVSASAWNLPLEFIRQLEVGGKLVIPVLDDVLEITKKESGELETTTHPGFAFVPLL